jgi:cytochrome c-type biogenesis protein CcmH/NrfG
MRVNGALSLPKVRNFPGMCLEITGLKKCVLLVVVLLFLSSGSVCLAQRGVPPSRVTGFTLFGDVEVVETEKREAKSVLFDLLLYTRSGVLIDRQKVGSKGRYRFLNVPAGDYDLVFEFENAEVARTQIRLVGIPTDFRQDVTLEWRAGPVAGKSSKPEVISADDLYDRKTPNRERFENAREAFDKKDYDRAIAILRQIVTDDPKDFPAWSELGTCYLVQNDLNEAEVAYLSATGARPTFFRALVNLGKVRIMLKNFEGAIEPLTEAVKVQPTSADANYYLGEAYLQLKKGSKAVGYLNEAAKLGRADAHLRLATLYHAAGMKDMAALEYEAFLKKKPDYAERKKLEEYIAANKKK